mgnify:CR=1 FL=1
MKDTKIHCVDCAFEPVECDYFFLFGKDNIALCVPDLKHEICPVCGERLFNADACDRIDAAIRENPLSAAQIRVQNKRKK